MKIRKSRLEDLDTIMEIYTRARRFMAEHGNLRQWGATNWPPEELIRHDIEVGKSYVCADGETLLAVFYYDFGADIEPTYRVIQEGKWQDGTPYGVVHRLAAAEGVKGAGRFCLDWAFAQSGHLRVDTHTDNTVIAERPRSKEKPSGASAWRNACQWEPHNPYLAGGALFATAIGTVAAWCKKRQILYKNSPLLTGQCR